jgi:hypothetical protein
MGAERNHEKCGFKHEKCGFHDQNLLILASTSRIFKHKDEKCGLNQRN